MSNPVAPQTSREERIELPGGFYLTKGTAFSYYLGHTSRLSICGRVNADLVPIFAAAMNATPMPVQPSDEEIATKICADWINQRVPGAFQTPATPTWDEVRHLIKQALARHRQAAPVEPLQGGLDPRRISERVSEKSFKAIASGTKATIERIEELEASALPVDGGERPAPHKLTEELRRLASRGYGDLETWHVADQLDVVFQQVGGTLRYIQRQIELNHPGLVQVIKQNVDMALKRLAAAPTAANLPGKEVV